MPRLSIALEEEHLRVIAAALNELPYRIARPVMAELEAQVAAQRPPSQEPINGPPGVYESGPDD
jgi:hypothetical protein